MCKVMFRDVETVRKFSRHVATLRGCGAVVVLFRWVDRWKM